MGGLLPGRRSVEARLLRQGRVVAAAATGLEASVRSRTDPELRASTDALRARVASGTEVDALLPEAAAVVRETVRRVLGFRLDDEQVVGGVALHHGALVEMKTGEGKTATVLLPAFLAASAREPVHVMTANDYLARRDHAAMWPVFERLGLSSGLLTHAEVSQQELRRRRAAYAADVTYGTADEFAYDYLRDNLAWSPEELVQRGRGRALVDEADQTLIDQARTTPGICTTHGVVQGRHEALTRVVAGLRSGLHYVVDERRGLVTLTERGTARIEDRLGIADLNDSGGPELVRALDAVLRVKELYRRGRDYVVEDGAVALVDRTTGRLVDRGRADGGVMQALAAKEGLPVPPAQRRLTEIHMYAFLRGYRHLAGLTGVAEETEAYRRIYGLEIVRVPPARPVRRVDHPVRMYGVGEKRLEDAVRRTAQARADGRPVLLGTSSGTQAEEVSAALARRGVPHEVLTAGDHAREAEIVARAGRVGQVTVVTRMVGRGVDIPLGGAGASQADHDAVVRSGGLLVLALDLFENSRLELHMRGRAGRRGDPGDSEVLAALDDPTLTSMLSRYTRRMLASLTRSTGEPFVSSASSRELERNLAKRTALQAERLCAAIGYDDVQAEQTAEILRLRAQTREGTEASAGNGAGEAPAWVRQALEASVTRVVRGLRPDPGSRASSALHVALAALYPVGLTAEDLSSAGPDLLPRVLADIHAAHRRREEELSAIVLRELERRIRLSVIDRALPGHLDGLSDLHADATLNTLAGGDPLAVYRREAVRLLADLLERVEREFTEYLFTLKVEVEQLGPEAGS